MNIHKSLNSNSNNGDELNLSEIISVLWNKKIFILVSFLLSSALVVVYSLSLPNIYESRAIVAPAKQNSGSDIMGGLGGLASLAGISLPSTGGSDPTIQAKKRLESLYFFQEQIMPNIYLPDLMAFKSWDPINNSSSYSDKIYNTVEEKWVRKPSFPFGSEPSSQESFREFSEIFAVVQDIKTGFFTISIEHQSPYIAKQWVELIFNEINKASRNEAKKKAELSINYLNRKMEETKFSEIKLALSQLIQSEIQKLTLVESREDYMFEYLDPPVVSEVKLKPKRAIICVVGSFIGTIISILYVLLHHYVFKARVAVNPANHREH